MEDTSIVSHLDFGWQKDLIFDFGFEEKMKSNLWTRLGMNSFFFWLLKDFTVPTNDFIKTPFGPSQRRQGRLPFIHLARCIPFFIVCQSSITGKWLTMPFWCLVLKARERIWRLCMMRMSCNEQDRHAKIFHLVSIPQALTNYIYSTTRVYLFKETCDKNLYNVPNLASRNDFWFL